MAHAPSRWVQRWSHLVTPGGSVLDVACGSGRHMQWFAARGHQVTGVDRSPEAIAASRTYGHTVLADLENAPWPLMQGDDLQTFDAVVVTHYLWRALFDSILGSLSPGGVLIYETFASGNETVGKPTRADFLLQRGELLRSCAGLQVIAFEDGFLSDPPRFVQRIVAVREVADDSSPPRYPL